MQTLSQAPIHLYAHLGAHDKIEIGWDTDAASIHFVFYSQFHIYSLSAKLRRSLQGFSIAMC